MRDKKTRRRFYLHPKSLCETSYVGEGTRLWAFSHVLEGARIGKDVNLCDHTFVEGDVSIGDRVTVKSFVALWNGVRLEDDCFVGPGVVFANDKYPRSKMRPKVFLKTHVRRGASLGSGAVILGALK